MNISQEDLFDIRAFSMKLISNTQNKEAVEMGRKINRLAQAYTDKSARLQNMESLKKLLQAGK